MVTENELIQAISDSKSYREVGRKLNIGHMVVKRLMKEFGIKKPNSFEFGEKYKRAVGQTYNDLTIKSFYKKGRKHYCKCDCKCGKKDVEKRIDAVLNGRVPSCGCISQNRPQITGNLNPAFNGIGDIRAAHIEKIKRSASRREIACDLNKQQLWDLFLAQDKNCKLSGMPICFGRVYFCHETTASLDRIDSNKNYEEGNIQWVHKDINKMKGTFTQEYFIKLCKMVADQSLR